MSTKRWVLASALLICIAVAPFLVLALLPTEPGVTSANFRHVEIGMTQAEVEEIFGTPPGNTSPKGKNWWGLQML